MNKYTFLFSWFFVILFTATYASSGEEDNYVEIAGGTYGTSYLPVYGFYDYSWSRTIYLQSELGDAMTINKIAYQLYNSPNSYTMPNQTVWMKHTTETTISSSAYMDPGANGFTKVIDKTITFTGTAGNFITIDFNVSNFEYNGTDNLIIIWENRDGNYASGYPKWFYRSKSNRSVYKYADNNFPSQSGSICERVPNVRFYYNDPAPPAGGGGTDFDTDTPVGFAPGAITGCSPLVHYPFSSDSNYTYLSSNLTEATLDFSNIPESHTDFDGLDSAFLTPQETGVWSKDSAISFNRYYALNLDVTDSIKLDSLVFEVSGQWDQEVLEAMEPNGLFDPENLNQIVFIRSSLDNFESDLFTDTLSGTGDYKKTAIALDTSFERVSDVTFRFYFWGYIPGDFFWRNMTLKYGKETGEILCKEGDPAPILSVIDATGGDQNITYQWQSSSDIDFSSPVDIPDSDTTIYNPSSGVTTTTWYRRLAKDGSEGAEFIPSDGIWKLSLEDIPPMLNVKDIRIQLNEDGEARIIPKQLVSFASDDCGLGDTTLSNSYFSCENLGDNDVVVTLYDATGNSVQKTAKVTVEDNIPPVLDTKELTVSLDENGEALIESEDLIEFASDNCGIKRSAVNVNSFDCSNIGVNEVTVTVVDNYDNWGSKKAYVTIVDDTPPELELRNITLQLNKSGEASIQSEDLIILMSDNCKLADPVLSITNFNSGHLGNNEVTVTAYDESGNSTSASAIVNVIDVIDPSLEVQNISAELNSSGDLILSPADLVSLASDNCGIKDTVLSVNNFNCSNLGNNEVIITLTDLSGNSVEKSASVLVVDNQAPVITPVNDLIITLDPGICETGIEYPLIQVNDNCETELVLLKGLGEEGIFPQGMTTETWVASDQSGNTDTLTFNVIVSTLNANPEIDPMPDLRIKEDLKILTISLTGISSGNDCLPQTLNIEAVSSNTDLITILNLTKISESVYELNLETLANMNGTTEITITLTDNLNGVTTESFNITVEPVNDPPVLVAPIPDYTMNAGTELQISLEEITNLFFSDIDGDDLILSLLVEGFTGFPGWARITENTLICQPVLADIGCQNILATATDPSGASVTDTFNFCIEGYPTNISGKEGESIEVELYPNPSRGLVNLDFNSTIHNLQIIISDVSGRILLEKQYYETQHIAFELEEKTAGVLFVRMDIDGREMIKKLIIDNK